MAKTVNQGTSQANYYTDAIYYDYSRYLYWNEAGSLQAVVDPRFYSYYGYDGTGERTLKMAGDVSVMDVNADFMQVHAVMRKVTLYTSPYMVATNRGYTKHIYADGERICAKIGTGGLDALCPLVGHDAALTESARNLFDKVRGSMETRKVVETESGCDGGGNTDEPLASPARKIVAKVGFAIDDFRYTMTDLRAQGGREDDLFFYHPDLCKSREQIQAGLSYAETQQSVRSKHLGSASWITDTAGDAVQHIQYCPFGEPFVNEHATGAGYSERFTFTGKERDEETGYGYFGARYMDHELMNMWLSVDPMADKYPSISPYAYCNWNPIRLVDPDGREDWEVDKIGNIRKCKDQTNAIEGKDRLFAASRHGRFNKDGTPKEGFVEAEEGTFGKVETYKKDYTNLYDETISYSPSVIKFKDGSVNENLAKATEIFEFLAKNTDVEWTFTGHRDPNSENCPISIRIATSHMIGFDPYSYEYEKNPDIGSKCIFVFHNHHNALGYSEGDAKFKKLVPTAIAGIYLRWTNSYLDFDGKKMDGPKSIKL